MPLAAKPLNAVLPQFDQDVERIFGAYHIPGAAVAVVQNGRVVYIKTLGVGSTQKRNPVDEHTVFRLASVSKTFAAVCLLLFLALWLLSPAATRLGLKRRARTSGLRLQLLSVAALCSLLLLSACGTAPSPVLMQRPVPAALLVPPKAPTLLQPKLQPVPKAPASPSTTPGSAATRVPWGLAAISA